MKYKILKSCVGCRQCYRICPVQAITTGPMKIDSEKCIGCGKCYNSCPSKKIIKEESTIESSMCAHTKSVLGSCEGFVLREAERKDLDDILKLYLHLHETEVLEYSLQLVDAWENILMDSNHHLILGEVQGELVSSCVCVIIPNLTRNARPYAFVENVVTHKDYRGKGYASACLGYAKKIAEQNKCYKMMLLTGSKEEKTLDFYRNAGYNSSDKTAFVQWLGDKE